ncbi:MAG: hypothetical protein ABIJ81_03120 [Patescibacteria group bacterium]
MTQGLVTIRQNGLVKMKIITGCDGENTAKVARVIKKHGQVPSLTMAYNMAISKGFGSKEDWVVINETNILHRGNDTASAELHRKYFQQADLIPGGNL